MILLCAVLCIIIVLLTTVLVAMRFTRLKSLDRATLEWRIAVQFASELRPADAPALFCTLLIRGNDAAIARRYPGFTAYRAAHIRAAKIEGGSE